MATVNKEFLKKVAAYVNGTQQYIRTSAKAAEKVASMAPSVADALIAKGLIEPYQKEATVKALQDPAKALEILKAATSHVGESTMGKAAEDVSVNTTSGRKSDQAFIDRLYN